MALRRLAPWLAVAVAAVVAAAPRGELPSPHVAPLVTIDRALAVASDAPTFPLTVAAVPVALPDRWAASRPGYSGTVWYRVSFHLDPATLGGDAPALYLAQACSNVRIRLNGYVVFGGGRRAEPVSRGCHESPLVVLPAILLNDGDNVLDLRVTGYAQERVASIRGSGALSQLELGGQGALLAMHSPAYFWKGTWAGFSGFALIGIGFVLLAVGWLNRHEVYFSYLGLSCLGWVVATMLLNAHDLPWQNDITEFLLASMWPVLAALGIQFYLSFAGVRSRVIEALVAAQWVIVPMSLVVVGPEWLFPVARIWYTVLALELIAVMAIHLWVTRRRQPIEITPVAAVVVVSVSTLGIELATQWGFVAAPAFSPAVVVVPVGLAILGIALFLLFARAVRAVAQDRTRLRFELSRLRSEMEDRVESLTQQRVGQFTEAERRRIASDLHDDLGAKLLTIVHTTNASRLPQLAREALEEMRLSVRGLAGKAVRLEDAMADWRAETVARLEQAGVRPHWDTRAVPPEAILSARSFMQLTRILREAISNVIKHSGASNCRIQCEVIEGWLQFTLKDDGRGIDGDVARGHGVASMKRRAKRLSGQCLVESRPGHGVVISLTVPV